jgi:hypothetical protein
MSRPQTSNRYVYALNNPLKFVDPDGRAAAPAVVVSIGAALYLCASNPACTQAAIRGGIGAAAIFTSLKEAAEEALEAADSDDQAPAQELESEGEFSIIAWSDYPEGAPKPEGPFKILRGEEYKRARDAANNANRAMHKKNPDLQGQQIHEVKPVKFGGSPTDPANKVPLPPSEHAKLTTWWNRFLRTIEGRK